MKLAIIGSKDYQASRKVKDFIFASKQEFGLDLRVLSGGNRTGAEKFTKKYALELDIKYIEFNPAYTGHNLYSAEPVSYYVDKYHGSQILHRYNQMLFKCTHLVICLNPKEALTGIFKAVYKRAEKLNKSVVILR